MKLIKTVAAVLLVNIFCSQAFPQGINVFVKVRGNTGLEDKLKNTISKEFKSYGDIMMTEEKDKCQLYLDFTLVEQKPIRFYALGVCIAYYMQNKLYSRPTSDVAQFGEERMKDVCHYLVSEINKAFLEPLRKPAR